MLRVGIAHKSLEEEELESQSLCLSNSVDLETIGINYLLTVAEQIW